MAHQFNVRLPDLTHAQINELSQAHGLTKTQVVILALDRLYNALADQKEDAKKDIKRAKDSGSRSSSKS